MNGLLHIAALCLHYDREKPKATTKPWFSRRRRLNQGLVVALGFSCC